MSLHQYPWYPGTGAADERGAGNVFNVPRPPGLPRQRYVRDLLDAVDAALAGWEGGPDVLLVSAGFDSLAGALPGVDVISIGALTHSAAAADLSLTVSPARRG